MKSLMECQCTDFGVGSGTMVDADQWLVFKDRLMMALFLAGFIGLYPEFRAWAKNRGETVRYTTSSWRLAQQLLVVMHAPIEKPYPD